MITRLTVITVLIALFGVGVSSLAQTAGRPGSAFASVAGNDCDYRMGIVCSLKRDPARTHANF